MAQPTHTHNCDFCMYLGTKPSKFVAGKVIDLYVHERREDEDQGTFIARYSDEGPDYTSIPIWGAKVQAVLNPDFDIALDLYKDYKRNNG